MGVVSVDPAGSFLVAAVGVAARPVPMPVPVPVASAVAAVPVALPVSASPGCCSSCRGGGVGESCNKDHPAGKLRPTGISGSPAAKAGRLGDEANWVTLQGLGKGGGAAGVVFTPG